MSDWLDEIIQEDQVSLSDFQKHISEIEEGLSEEGMFAGLCQICLGTKYVMNYHDGYMFIQFKEENMTTEGGETEDKMRLIKCVSCMGGEEIIKGLPY